MKNFNPGLESIQINGRGTHPCHDAMAAMRFVGIDDGYARPLPSPPTLFISDPVSSSFPSSPSPLPYLCPRVWVSCRDVPTEASRMVFGSVELNANEVEKRLGGVAATATARICA